MLSVKPALSQVHLPVWKFTNVDIPALYTKWLEVHLLQAQPSWNDLGSGVLPRMTYGLSLADSKNN